MDPSEHQISVEWAQSCYSAVQAMKYNLWSGQSFEQAYGNHPNTNHVVCQASYKSYDGIQSGCLTFFFSKSSPGSLVGCQTLLLHWIGEVLLSMYTGLWQLAFAILTQRKQLLLKFSTVKDNKQSTNSMLRDILQTVLFILMNI